METAIVAAQSGNTRERQRNTGAHTNGQADEENGIRRRPSSRMHGDGRSRHSRSVGTVTSVIDRAEMLLTVQVDTHIYTHVLLPLSPSPLLSPAPVSSDPSANVGFGRDTSLLRDFALAAEQRALLVHSDFDHLAQVAAKEHKLQVKRDLEHQLSLDQFEADKAAREASYIAHAQRRKRKADDRVHQLEAQLAVLRHENAANQATRAADAASKASERAAKSHEAYLAASKPDPVVAPAATPIVAPRVKLSNQSASAMKSALKKSLKKESKLNHANKVADALALKAKSLEAKRLAALKPRKKLSKLEKQSKKVLKKAQLRAREKKRKEQLSKLTPSQQAELKSKWSDKDRKRTEERRKNRLIRAEAAKKAAIAKKAMKEAARAARRAAKKKAMKFVAELPTAPVSKVVNIPDWPSMTSPLNTARDTLVRTAPVDAPTVFKQPDASAFDNLAKFSKFTGRQSYTEHFQEWPTTTATVAATVTPTTTTTEAAAATTTVTTTAKTASKVAETVQTTSRFNPWIICAIVSGTSILCLFGAAIYYRRRKKKAEMGGEVNGYQAV